MKLEDDPIVQSVCLFLYMKGYELGEPLAEGDYKLDILGTVNDSSGRCVDVCDELFNWFCEFEPCRFVVCSMLHTTKGGFVGGCLRNAWHCLIQVGQWIIDLTGAQFGEEYAGARFLTEEQLEAEWVMVVYKNWGCFYYDGYPQLAPNALLPESEAA